MQGWYSLEFSNFLGKEDDLRQIFTWIFTEQISAFRQILRKHKSNFSK